MFNGAEEKVRVQMWKTFIQQASCFTGPISMKHNKAYYVKVLHLILCTDYPSNGSH